MTSFPWRIYTEDRLNEEYIRLCKKINEPLSFPLKRSIIGYLCSNHFFQYERLNTPCLSGRVPSCLERWGSDKSRKTIMDASLKTGKDLFGSAVFYSHSPAQFPVVSAGKLYKYFGAQNVFDPYAGWGDRCLASMACGVNYVGVDCNPKLVDYYNNMIEFFNPKSDVKFISGKAEDTDYKELNYDLLFSSPPYWKDGVMLECYNNCENDYNKFMNDSLYPIVEDAIKKGAMVCLHLPFGMFEDLRNRFGEPKEIIEMQKNTIPTNSVKTDKFYCWKGGC